jgi:hypothetical protein
MPISIIFWVIMLVWVLFGGYRMQNAGWDLLGGTLMQIVLFGLLGWRVFGPAVKNQ